MKCCHVFYLHTDRPRCYALMREDYLWSPLQSACSMQHLRSVSTIGRQWPSTHPHLPYHQYPPPFFWLTFPSTSPLCILFHLLPCRYPEWCVSTLLLPASSSPGFITCKCSMEITQPHPAAHYAHTFSRTPGAKRASHNRGNFKKNVLYQAESEFHIYQFH